MQRRKNVIPNIATTTSVESAMTTDGNKNNVNANIETVDDIFKDENLMKFFFHLIDQLEVQPIDFVDFEVFLKSSYHNYCLNYSPFALIENYVKAIEILFENHNTMSIIQNKLELKFLLFTQDVITQDAIVVCVPENKSLSKFMIVGGSCILNDKMNNFFTNDYETTENELENMKVDWKIETLISFVNHKIF